MHTTIVQLTGCHKKECLPFGYTFTTFMVTLESYVNGTHRNSVQVLRRYAPHVTLLRTLNSAFGMLLPVIGSGAEGAAIFAGMSHAAFLAGVKLVTSGELPSSNMVLRGCLENALYGFYLYHHPELKTVWMARHDSDKAKQEVRDAFTIGRMKKLLTEKSAALGAQFSLVYETSIDLGAHPNTLAFTAHLSEPDDSGDQVWQYMNLSSVDQAMGFRMAAMAGLTALNIFAVIFTDAVRDSGAGALLVRAHNELEKLPDAGSDEETAAAEHIV